MQTQTVRVSCTQAATRPRPVALKAGLPKAGISMQRRSKHSTITRASRDGSSGFWGGFVTGGIVLGALGYVFAPQISKALLGEDQKLRLPRFLEEQPIDPEISKQNLADQIAQLNQTIDSIHQSLNPAGEKEGVAA